MVWSLVSLTPLTTLNRPSMLNIDDSAHSKMISPVFEKLAGSPELSDKIIFAKVDVDAQEQIAQECAIRVRLFSLLCFSPVADLEGHCLQAMPTFMAFKNGEKQGQVIGADPNKLRVSTSMLSQSVQACTE